MNRSIVVCVAVLLAAACTTSTTPTPPPTVSPTASPTTSPTAKPTASPSPTVEPAILAACDDAVRTLDAIAEQDRAIRANPSNDAVVDARVLLIANLAESGGEDLPDGAMDHRALGLYALKLIEVGLWARAAPDDDEAARKAAVAVNELLLMRSDLVHCRG